MHLGGNLPHVHQIPPYPQGQGEQDAVRPWQVVFRAVRGIGQVVFDAPNAPCCSKTDRARLPNLLYVHQIPPYADR